MKGYLMQEDTTTSDASEETQAQEITEENPVDNRAELEKEATTEAVEPSEETSQASEAETTEPADADNSDDNSEIRDWAAKKNLPLDDPIKLAKMYRESEKALGKKGQEAGQLKQAVTTANSEANVDDIQALQNQFAALSFKVEHNVDTATEEQMVKVLDDRPWLAGDLDAVLLIAKGQNASTTEAQLLEARKTGEKDALANTAQAQRAGPPKASATTRETPPQFLTDKQVGELSPSEYAAAKAAGKIQY